ncbi:kinase-like protein [Penicillium diatomitis]|uniref:Kinase-like protein n=1 Tax=Penicillium diatomitis TaxID=2819901 RepID=A0A9X0BNR0_9EURO|nr:kinase-like protein [Penicillium diatomitis]KAJ5477008.1 kinase-like protein [Penicillium diatomitis]
MSGFFAEVYLVNNMIIRKASRSGSEEDFLLHDHPRIAECICRGRMDFIDITIRMIWYCGELFVDDDFDIRLSDFDSSHYPGYENATHFLPTYCKLPDTFEDIVHGRRDPQLVVARFSREQAADPKVQQRYENHAFHEVYRLFRGDMRLGLWKGGGGLLPQNRHSN